MCVCDSDPALGSLIRIMNQIATKIWLVGPWAALRKLVRIHSYSLQIVTLFTDGEESWIVIRNPPKTPDRQQRLNSSSLGHDQPLRKILTKSVHNFLSYPTDKQTDPQRNRQTLSHLSRLCIIGICLMFYFIFFNPHYWIRELKAKQVDHSGV